LVDSLLNAMKASDPTARRDLAETVGIVATDLNQPMLDLAATLPGLEWVRWRQADAQKLPFNDQTFDALLCQFGIVFLPDKSAALIEAYRVPGI